MAIQAEQAALRLRARFVNFLREHRECVWRAAGMAAAPGLWAVVPSGRGRGGEHPLAALVAPHLVKPRVNLKVQPGRFARGRDLDADWLTVAIHPARILYYFSVHLRIIERPSVVVDISDQLDAKVAALRCYRSQLVDNQPEGRPGVIETVCDRTRYWGQLAGVRHAEPFASREPIGLRGLDQLLL